MKKAVLNAEQAFPDVRTNDTILYIEVIMEREAFIKGYEKAIDSAVEWLQRFDAVNYKDFNQDDGVWVFNRKSFIEDFKKEML